MSTGDKSLEEKLQEDFQKHLLPYMPHPLMPGPVNEGNRAAKEVIARVMHYVDSEELAAHMREQIQGVPPEKLNRLAMLLVDGWIQMVREVVKDNIK